MEFKPHYKSNYGGLLFQYQNSDVWDKLKSSLDLHHFQKHLLSTWNNIHTNIHNISLHNITINFVEFDGELYTHAYITYMDIYVCVYIYIFMDVFWVHT